MKFHITLPLGLLGALAISTATPGLASGSAKFSGMRAHAFIQYLNQFYSIPKSIGVQFSGQYDRIVKVDSIRCEWDKAASVFARCSLKVNGQEVTSHVTGAWSPEGSLFQMLRETGGAWVDAQRPSVIVAAGADVSCSAYEHGPSYYDCIYTPVIEGDRPMATPFTAKVTGVRANDALADLSGSGIPNSTDRQFAKKLLVDEIKCTATLIDYQSHSDLACVGTAGGKSLNLNHSVGIYRLLAESGGASYDAATNAYVASAYALECVSTNTHEDQHATCTFTLRDRQQVIGWMSHGYVAPEQRQFFLQTLKELGAARPSDAAAGILSLDSIACTNPSVTADRSSGLTCKIEVNGQPTPSSDHGSAVYTLAKIIADERGDILDPINLSGTINYGSHLYCNTSNDFAWSCDYQYISSILL